jgi:hypothetical protein
MFELPNFKEVTINANFNICRYTVGLLIIFLLALNGLVEKELGSKQIADKTFLVPSSNWKTRCEIFLRVYRYLIYGCEDCKTYNPPRVVNEGNCLFF